MDCTCFAGIHLDIYFCVDIAPDSHDRTFLINRFGGSKLFTGVDIGPNSEQRTFLIKRFGGTELANLRTSAMWKVKRRYGDHHFGATVTKELRWPRPDGARTVFC